MKKKMISLAAALTCLTAAVPVNAGAIAYGSFNVGSEKFNNRVSGMEFLDKFSDKNTLYYYDKNVNSKLDMINVFTSWGKDLCVVFSNDADMAEIEAIINELAPDIYFVLHEDWEQGEQIKYLYLRDEEARPETDGIIKQLRDEFTKRFDVKRFEYHGHVYHYDYIELLLEKNFRYSFFGTGETAENVQAVIDEYGMDFEITNTDLDYSPDAFMVAPTVKMTFEESTEQLMPFIEKYGLYGFDTSIGKPLSADGGDETEAIDVLNSTDGDANCDSKLSIADATAIMQSIGNPDKYGLSMQGKFNADIYNTGDGITGMDAVAVMEKCLE